MVACPFQGFPTKPGCYGIMHDGKEGGGLGSLGPGGWTHEVCHSLAKKLLWSVLKFC